MTSPKFFPWYALVVLSCFFVIWPLVGKGFFISDDGEWMVIRLSAFYQSLAEGQFPVRFLGRLNYSFGYPVANFLYPGFLYIGSLLHFIGLSFVGAVKYILGASVVVSAMFLFASLKKRTSGLSAYAGVLSFLTAPYLAFDLYTRGSVGEVLAICAAAMSIWTIETNRRVLFPLAFALLIVSHNSLALLFAVFLCTHLILSKRFDWFIGLFIGVGLSSFFWIPALVEREFVRFALTRISDPGRYFVSIDNIDLIGLPFIAALAIYLVRGRRMRSSSYGSGIYVIGFFLALFFASPWSGAFWRMESFATLFQFPFRFLALALLCGPWMVAYSVEYLASFRGKLVGVYAIFGLLSLFPILSAIEYVDRPDGYYVTNEATTTVANEYMPVWVSVLPTQRTSNRIEIYEGRGTIEPRTITTQRIDANLILEVDSTITLNTVYYPGWGVVIDDHPVKILYENERGLIRVNVPKGTHRLVADFRETPMRFGADSITLISLVIYLLFLFRSAVYTKKL